MSVPPHHCFRGQSQTQVVTHASDQVGYKSELLTTSSSVWLICQSGSQNSGISLLCLLKDVIKNTYKQLDKEIHRSRLGRVPRTGASVSVELRYVISCMWKCSFSWKLCEPHAVSIFMEAWLIINSSPSPSPLSGRFGVGLKLPSF